VRLDKHHQVRSITEATCCRALVVRDISVIRIAVEELEVYCKLTRSLYSECNHSNVLLRLLTGEAHLERLVCFKWLTFLAVRLVAHLVTIQNLFMSLHFIFIRHFIITASIL